MKVLVFHLSEDQLGPVLSVRQISPNRAIRDLPDLALQQVIDRPNNRLPYLISHTITGWVCGSGEPTQTDCERMGQQHVLVSMVPRELIQVFPNSSMQRSTSRASSHFCDLELEVDMKWERLEEGKDEEKDDERHFPYARNRASLFSIANILALTLCRSEAFLRLVFWLAVTVLGRPWIPLPIKTATTSILQNLGGIHSSCGISSVVWLVYALVPTLKDGENTYPEIIGVAAAILSLLCLSCLAAFPLVRHLHHNVFERIHRFAGWTVLCLLWAFIILTISYDPLTKSYSKELVGRVPVKVSAPSGHASIIKSEGGIKSGLLGRISPSPFSEWHAFGIISDGKTEHMMLSGAVGDFTNSLSPTHRTIWSGICVFLSFLLQPCSANVCVLWVAKGIEQNYGKEIKEMVSEHPKEKVIVHDTAVLDRPNVSQMSVDAAKRWVAEVVIVTSNPKDAEMLSTLARPLEFQPLVPFGTRKFRQTI
ncbi:putative triacylglycerol lipase [Hibiscus syriacus]|uniref:Triacylglycerol lipase n=1 Tax=Hibiscus syriacus TaxID=106335 RepID=A0A6A3BGJ5_HIBSY|nr:putative triacylglycerol lipase [Hibiscus syriacus]